MKKVSWFDSDELPELEPLSKDSIYFIDKQSGEYYFIDECWASFCGPFATEESCKHASVVYAEAL